MPATTTVDGMPVDAFLDDLKSQLRQVHWHVRGRIQGCGAADLREVDLRDGTVTLVLDRLQQVDAGTSVKLVAVPLAHVALSPTIAVDASRKETQKLTLKLAVAGDVPLVDFDHAPVATVPVAQAVNAAIDGFMRSGREGPCMRLASLKLELVVDVAKQADGGFKVVVPAIAFNAGIAQRSVNTLTLDWARIESHAVH